ncbi:hypothetical protein RJT34_32527 [Clitoria ternatea]|uniref:DUF4283 domain-containing protein n=1 Tax=Clitoria ternatea TaxID=43366 RepID=A0AAN9EWA8_CLITE
MGRRKNPPFDPCPKIPASKEDFDSWCKNGKLALIVKVIGKKIPMNMLEANITRNWAAKGSIQVIDMPNEFFLLHFTAEEDYNVVGRPMGGRRSLSDDSEMETPRFLLQIASLSVYLPGYGHKEKDCASGEVKD